MIIVTGGNGHLGQWVIAALTERGYDVVNISRKPSQHPSIAGIVWKRPVKAVVCDLSNKESVRGVQDELSQAEAVIHLAGHIPLSTSSNEDCDASDTMQNVFSIIHLLESLGGNTHLQSIVYASTFEVYGAPQYTPIDENHPTHPLSYYGASKLAGEKYLQLFDKDKNIPCSSLRFPAIYGPGDTLDRAVGNFIKAAVQNSTIKIHGDGKDLRDMVYVSDAAEAIVKTMEAHIRGTLNIGNGKGVSISEIAQLASRMANNTVKILTFDRQKPRIDYVLDSSQAKKMLDWNPRVPLLEGIRAQFIWEKNKTS